MDRYVIDPWVSHQYKDYKKLRDEFGIEPFDFQIPELKGIFTRGVIFGQRGFQSVYNAIRKGKKFTILTGLMPSGKMHLGHKLVIDQMINYQKIGAKGYIAVADLEAYATRNISPEKGYEIAIRDYVPNYLALGVDPQKTQVYFQSKRKSVMDLALLFQKRINLNEMKEIYGFRDDSNLLHIESPLIQLGDILHVQLDKYEGPCPTVVPVGVDQDPHIRLARELVKRNRIYSIVEQDGRIVIFYKGDDTENFISKAKEKLKGIGFEKFRENIPYKALYIDDSSTESKYVVEEVMSEVEKEFGGFGFFEPSSTYHRFMSGLNGGKMSSSDPSSYISIDEDPNVATKKVMNAKTGGAASAEEQRRVGGKPEECSVYELYLYHLAEDDNYLKEIYRSCRSGERLCGECKREAAELLKNFLIDLKEKREEREHLVREIVKND